MTITVKITNQPSSSKGWGRYAIALEDGTAVMSSRTGNKFMSAGHAGEVEAGTVVVVTTQVMRRVGKYNKEEITTETYRLVAEEGGSRDLGYTLGNTLGLTVEGAK